MKTKRAIHRYNPLDSAAGRIRLLTVLPKPGSTTHISLEDALLDDVNGQFDAVSYVWSNPEPCRHVVVNGKKLRVRDNIWQCLKHLRQHKMVSKPLWIDCICINQADTAEKGQQVARMSGIFSSASTVFVWLGRTSRLFQPGQIQGHAMLRDALYDSSKVELLENIVRRQDPVALVALDQLMRLVYDEYWHRLWIVQEIALASGAQVVMGNMLVNADTLAGVYNTIRDASKPVYYTWLRRQCNSSFEDRGTGILGNHPICSMRMGQPSRIDGVDLARLIETYRTKLCTVPRDRIYGLLGLTSSHHCPPVDYRCSAEELLLRTMICLHAEAQDVISQEFDGDNVKVLGFDSWIVACVMQSLEITAETIRSTIVSSSFLSQKYARRFELMLQPHEVILPCARAPEDKMTLDKQCTSIQAPSGRTEHFWKRIAWAGPHPEKHFRVKHTGVSLLICSIGLNSLLHPAFLLSIDTNQQIRVE